MSPVSRRAFTWLALVALLGGCAAFAAAAELEGRVVAIRDGDTVDVLTADNARARVRLAGIDAPESGQPYGNAAKRALSALTYREQVRVAWAKHDDYGRIVGTVYVRGADVNLRMIERGLAWHYKAYAAEQGGYDRRRYAAAEASARSQRLGLWRDASPVPPWEYRHGTGVRAP